MTPIWGRRAVLEALRSGRTVRKAYMALGAKPVGALGEIIAATRERGIPLVSIPVANLDRLAAGGNHQGILVEAAEFRYADIDDLLSRAATLAEPPFLLILDHLEDPQNFGTLLRTAEAVGVHGAIIPRERAVGVTPAVEKASAGAVEHLLIARVVNLPRAIESLQARGVWIVGLDASAPRGYEVIDYDSPIALVVGSEGHGLSRLLRAKCDLLVRLPMRGKVASLNAAVAGSVLLYHIWRGRAKTS